MPPEIEWEVDTSSHSQAIIKTPPPQSSSPRNKIILLIVITLGITLGVIYRSIPEPPQPPTPTPTPAPTIFVSLTRAIDQEARALEEGSVQSFIKLQDPADQQWRAQQLTSFKKWGEPPDYSDLYTIVESGTLSSDLVWVDISQARDGQYFRETRFYRSVNGQWFRTSPDVSFWGDGRALRTNHFDLHFQEGDNYHAQIVAQQLEKFYNRVCRDLNCTLGKPIEPVVFRVCKTSDCSDVDGIEPNPMSQFTLILSPIAQTTTVDASFFSGYSEPHITVTLPSPRLSGLYFQSLYNSSPGNDEPIERMAIENLFVPHFVAKLASGGVDRWSRSVKGNFFAGSIEQWEINRITPISALSDAQIFSTLQNVKDQDLLSLDVLWVSMPPYDLPQSQLDKLVAEIWSVIRFIETKHGADGVVHFLNAIGPAQSISDALQNGLNVSYADFDREWRAWLKEQLAK
jgi:hypothetical protein